MYAGSDGTCCIGLLYIAPALALCRSPSLPTRFVQMVWVSLHSWSLITPPKYVGFDNFITAFNDEQFWVSLGLHAEIHALHHADPDDRRLSDRAAHRREHAAQAALRAASSSCPWCRARRLEPPLVLAVLARLRPDQSAAGRPRDHLEADPLAGGRCRDLDLGDHRLGGLEGDRLRHVALRRRRSRPFPTRSTRPP